MTATQRSELEVLHLENVRIDAIQALVERDPARARSVATRARATAEEFFTRSDELAKRAIATYSNELVGEYVRVVKTALFLSSVSKALERELEYLYPRRPLYF